LDHFADVPQIVIVVRLDGRRFEFLDCFLVNADAAVYDFRAEFVLVGCECFGDPASQDVVEYFAERLCVGFREVEYVEEFAESFS